MKRRLRLRRIALVAVATLVIGGLAVGGTFAAFKSQTDNPSNSVTAASDFRAPPITAQVQSKTQGGASAYLKQGGTYYIYAYVGADTGNPATGISSVTADASNLTTGQTSVAMVAGSYTVGATTYNYRTASLTANAVLAAGSQSFSISATDGNSNTSTQSGTVTVDNTPPTASDVQATNGAGNVAGDVEAGDSIVYTFSEPVESYSLAWNGAAKVTVRLLDGGGAVTDKVQIWDAANTTQLAFGQVDLADKAYSNANVNFTNSTMTASGNAYTIVLGTASGAVKSGKTAAAMVWTPSTSTRDRADNAGLATPATESGAPVDLEF
jgi:hypothetical protein